MSSTNIKTETPSKITDEANVLNKAFRSFGGRETWVDWDLGVVHMRIVTKDRIRVEIRVFGLEVTPNKKGLNEIGFKSSVTKYAITFYPLGNQKGGIQKNYKLVTSDKKTQCMYYIHCRRSGKVVSLTAKECVAAISLFIKEEVAIVDALKGPYIVTNFNSLKKSRSAHGKSIGIFYIETSSQTFVKSGYHPSEHQLRQRIGTDKFDYTLIRTRNLSNRNVLQFNKVQAVSVLILQIIIPIQMIRLYMKERVFSSYICYNLHNCCEQHLPLVKIMLHSQRRAALMEQETIESP
ncbi:hypothetical protein Bhyg_13922 [Pseudolycoriella hygida]|uniref:Uncharacterized protein n=1 Tax=Pseudolycoriella hygida TaxID=35572 RepID=A0A9Q0RWS8_9DIPT|nr:hypothetical protein Bhyg_13922 [Pseudolycoriella hygida]